MNTRARQLITLLFASALVACGESEDTDAQYEQPQAWAQSPMCGLAWNAIEVGQTGAQDLAIRNEGNQTLVIESVEIQDEDKSGFLEAELGTAEAEYKGSALVRVKFTPTEAGWDRALLVIKSNAQNYPTLKIPVLALAYPAGGNAASYDPGAKPTREGDEKELCPVPPDDGKTGD